MFRVFSWLAFAALLLGLFLFFKPKRYDPGVLIPNDPVQTDLPGATSAFEKDGFTIKPLATYEIEARVLHTKHYPSGLSANLAPYDFAVGWGPMSNQRVLDALRISQGNRFFFYEWQTSPPIPKEEIISHAANMHLIPADAFVERRIRWTSAGDLIRMKGYLVEVQGTDLPRWRSSLSRTDTGNGACELMWVESFEQLQPGEARSAQPATPTVAGALTPR